jgi:hypothetical protein
MTTPELEQTLRLVVHALEQLAVACVDATGSGPSQKVERLTRAIANQIAIYDQPPAPAVEAAPPSPKRASRGQATVPLYICIRNPIAPLEGVKAGAAFPESMQSKRTLRSLAKDFWGEGEDAEVRDFASLTFIKTLAVSESAYRRALAGGEIPDDGEAAA